MRALVLVLCLIAAQAYSMGNHFRPMPYGGKYAECEYELSPLTKHKVVFYSRDGADKVYPIADFVCPFWLTASKYRLTQDAQTGSYALNIKLPYSTKWDISFTFSPSAESNYVISAINGTKVEMNDEMHDNLVDIRNKVLSELY